ncbi:MAG: AAA family ATPase, partial [Bacteriovorax sp.]|nr:AAA family ATPase [Bacteriovorax sp.]
MERYLTTYIKKDLEKKIVLISGPRQTGKTTLSKMLNSSFEYLNYDNEESRNRIEKKEWDRKKKLLILDELHKMLKWKSWLKGIYDVEGIPPALLVTGSAKLDTYRKVGDSLAGRYFSFRLYPLDLKELKNNEAKFNLEKSFAKMLEVGGFPEPFFDGSLEYYKRWRRTHLDIIIKQDLITLEKVSNIIGIENLIRLLRT